MELSDHSNHGVKTSTVCMGSQGHRRGPLYKEEVASAVDLRGGYLDADLNNK